jgi:prepilin peptidase dependent protein B
MLNLRRYHCGTSLVELMISMAIGLASLTAMASLVGHGIGLNSQLLAKSRLDEEINAIAALLVSDIKRAGYDANMIRLVSDPSLPVSPFADSLLVSNYPSEVANSCVTFAYDRNQNGQLDTQNTNEHFGFRLKDKAIEMRIDGLACNAGGWHDLTDPNVVKVSKLQFSVQGHARHGINASRVKLLLEAELKHNGSISKRLTTSFMVKNHDPL